MKKNIIKILGVFFIIVFILPLIIKSNASAANTIWYYTTLAPMGVDGRVEVGGYVSKEDCLKDLKTVHSSYSPSTDCYLAENVKITSFSPAEGKFGDTITINGSSFIDVQKVFFGGTEVNIAYIITDSPTKIRILGVPANVTDGKITVKTKFHGEAISATNFIISSTPSDMRWWYKDIANNNIKGPWTEIKDCNKDRNIYKAGLTTISLSECFPNTITNIEKEKADNLILHDNSKQPVNTKTNYTLLAPLPDGSGNNEGFTEFESDPNKNPCAFGKYMNMMLKIIIGIAAVLAMIMIIKGGFEYMASSLPSGKESGKGTITQAILGLLIALGAYLILFTINPNLLNFCLDEQLPKVNAVIGGDTDTPTVFNRNMLPAGIICSGNKSNIPNIAKSFDGKMTYEMGAKGIAGPNNTIKLDCSGFVNYVLDCANSNFVSGGTYSIFTNAEKVTSISGTKVNNTELKIGDLVGWRVGDTKNYKYGHVMIYIGNGNVQVADSHGGSGVGDSLGIFPITKYQGDIKFIKRIP